MSEPRKRKKSQKNEIENKEKRNLKKMNSQKKIKSKNFSTISMSVSDNCRIYVMWESDNVRAPKNEISKKKWNLKKKKEISKKMKSKNFRAQSMSV